MSSDPYFVHLAKNWRNLLIRSLIFLQNALLSSILLALCLFLQRFQMPLEGLSFVKILAKCGNFYPTEPLLQNMAKIVCLHWLTLETWITCMCANFLQIRVVFHTLCRKWSQLPPILFAFLKQITHYLTAAKILKILINWKMLALTWLHVNIVLQKVLLPPPQPQSK